MSNSGDQDSVAVVAKRHGVSDATIYFWRKKFGQLYTDETTGKGLSHEQRLLKGRDLRKGKCSSINPTDENDFRIRTGTIGVAPGNMCLQSSMNGFDRID